MTTPPDETPDPPETPRDDVTETFHGTEVADPYRWLEGDGEEVREWTAAQNEYAGARLDAPARERLQPRMADLADVTEYGTVKPAGGRYFRTVRDPGDGHPRLLVREDPTRECEETVLVDPNDWPENADPDAPPRSLAWFLPAPDGERVAYGVTEGGDEMVDIRVASVPDGGADAGAADPEKVAVREDCGRVSVAFVGFDALSPGMVAWDADGEGLYYVATDPSTDGDTEKEVRHWRFDGGETSLFSCDEGQVWPLVRTDPASGTLAVALHDGPSTDWYVHVDGDMRPVIEDSDAESFVTFRDGRVFVRTDRDAPRKRLLACSLAQFRAGDLSLADCETVLPEREAVLGSVVTTPEYLVAHYLADAHSRLAVYDHDGTHVRDLPLPDCASVSRLRNADGENPTGAVVFRVESFDRPPTLVRADPATGERHRIAQVDVDVPENLVVEQAFVESEGGVEVPLFVCHRADLDRDGDNPAVLHGYGGFGATATPEFDRFRVPFLADGGVYAQVCARGGGEYGEAWHDAGRLADKPNTFADFAAAGEWLCERGYTNPDRLAVTGRSNGGLSVGGVLTRRPDLWAAARCSVPLLDMLRYHRFGMGASWTTEYGDPHDPEAFEFVRDYSPYHNVEPGTEYPPVLFTTGAQDTRVHPCHARKMAARMQVEAEGGPFLLRTRTDAGHGVGTPADAVVAERVEEWTFLYEQLEIGKER